MRNPYSKSYESSDVWRVITGVIVVCLLIAGGITWLALTTPNRYDIFKQSCHSKGGIVVEQAWGPSKCYAPDGRFIPIER